MLRPVTYNVVSFGWGCFSFLENGLWLARCDFPRYLRCAPFIEEGLGALLC
jgi:hypothetical protein